MVVVDGCGLLGCGRWKTTLGRIVAFRRFSNLHLSPCAEKTIIAMKAAPPFFSLEIKYPDLSLSTIHEFPQIDQDIITWSTLHTTHISFNTQGCPCHATSLANLSSHADLKCKEKLLAYK
jgi:hypothetical protein